MNLNLRRALRLTNIRILSQVFFFVAFMLAVWATWTSRLGGYPVSRLLEMDPLVTLSTALATGYVYRFLGWALLILAASGPTAVNTLLLTLELDGDADGAANCVFWTTLGCAVTAPVVIALLRMQLGDFVPPP